MSEYTLARKRISSRHHISTQLRHVEEKLQSTPASDASTSTSMSDHQPPPSNAAAPTNTPPPYHPNANEASLTTHHDPITPPFHENLSPISSPHTSSTTLAPDQPRPSANEFGATSRNTTTNIQNDTALLIDSISTLEADLHHERGTATNLATTLSQERLTFEQRMLKME